MISPVFSFAYRNQRLVNRDPTPKLLCDSYFKVTETPASLAIRLDVVFSKPISENNFKLDNNT